MVRLRPGLRPHFQLAGSTEKTSVFARAASTTPNRERDESPISRKWGKTREEMGGDGRGNGRGNGPAMTGHRARAIENGIAGAAESATIVRPRGRVLIRYAPAQLAVEVLAHDTHRVFDARGSVVSRWRASIREIRALLWPRPRARRD